MNCEKMSKLIQILSSFCEKKNNFLNKFISPILLLSLRIMIATVFFKSGLTKISNFDSTLLLFEYEYAVPVVRPIFAAYSATLFELTCPILLVLGFATRIATLPLIAMTLVIQFTVFENPEHFYWLTILTTILVYGGGFLSLDNPLKKMFAKCIVKNS